MKRPKDPNHLKGPRVTLQNGQKGYFLIDEPGTGWKELSDIRWTAIYRGETRIPELAGKTMRMAAVTVTYEDSNPTELNVGILYWKFSDDGYIDRDSHGLPYFNRSSVGAIRNPYATDEDIDAIESYLSIGKTSQG